MMGNKVDLENRRVVTTREMESFCDNRVHKVQHYESSAKLDHGVDECFSQIVVDYGQKLAIRADPVGTIQLQPVDPLDRTAKTRPCC